MSRSPWIRCAVAGCAVVAILAAGCAVNKPSAKPSPATTSAPPTAPSRPNVLFLLTDDLRLSDISVMPNLKKLLIDQGTSFSNYFVSVSLCCPSRTTTLRGQYAHNTGILTNGGSTGGFGTAHSSGIESSTTATWLHSAGYRTALIGKYLNGYPEGASDTYVPPGWDEWDSASRGGSAYSEFDYTLNENGKLVQYGHEPEDYGTDVYTKKAVDFVTKAASDDKPFFTYLAVYAPHGPATPAPRHEGLFAGVKAPRTASYDEPDVSDKPQWVRDRPLLAPGEQQKIDDLYRKRLQSLQAVDDGIATLVHTLEENHQMDDTYFVFTSDNGFHLGQHRLPSGKQTAYEEDVHLPLIVRGPGVAAGRSQTAIVGNVDLAPTFADLAGASAPSFVDGRSLAPLLHGDGSGTRRAYLLEHESKSRKAKGAAAPDPTTQEPDDPDQAATTTAHGLAGGGSTAARQKKQAVRIPAFRGLRTTRYTYVEYVTGEKELYDLRSDPNELDNIASKADKAVLDQLSQRLHGLRSCQAADCRALEDRPSP